MSVLFQDGIDMYGTDELKVEQAGWSRSGSQETVQLGLGRFGGGCLCPQFNHNFWRANLPSPATTLFIGWSFWYKGGLIPSSNNGILRLVNSGDYLVGQLYVNGGSRHLEIMDANGVVQATSSWALVPTMWHTLQAKVVVHGTTGSIEVFRGADTVIATNIDTLPSSGDGSIASVRFGQVVHAGLTDNRIDDVAIWDDSGPDWNTWTDGKDFRIDTIRPNADTAQEDFLPFNSGDNFAEVDDDPDHDVDATYNGSDTGGNKDRLELSTVTSTPVEIYNVRARACARKTNASAVNLKVGVYSGVTESMSAAKGLSTDYGYHYHDEEINPDDSLPWELADIDALQVEYEHA